jgi:hypothetical protein
MQGPQVSLVLEPRNRRRLLVILLRRGVALREVVPFLVSAEVSSLPDGSL